MTKEYKYQRIFIIFFITLIIGCGGGGGSGDEPVNPPDSNGGTLNKNLSGKLYFQDYLQYVYLIDASTGLVKYIQNTDWNNQRDRFPSGVSTFYSQARQNNGTEFLMVAADCNHSNPDPLSPMMSCIAIQDYEGNYLSQMNITGVVSNGARLSPDGQFIAFYRDLDEGRSGQEWLEIYNRSWELVSDKKDSSKKFVWLNNGVLMYTYNRHFVFTERHSTNDDYFLSLPDIINGIDVTGSTLDDYAISPDNMQIAFTLNKKWDPSARFSGDILFIMNSDGTNIRKLAISMNDTYQIIDDITWSPDGRWVMVKEGYTAGQDDNALGTAGYLYVIPTEDLGKVFQLSIADSERSPEVIQFQHDRNLTESGTLMTTRALGRSTLEWIP
ncbi:MAG: hypothetical protein ABW101_19290 [Candidatus Thiodiazotropha sp.]